MTRGTQGLLMAVLGVLLLRLGIGDAHLRYVTEWMRWPLLASGALLLLFALGPLWSGGDQHEEHAPDGHDGHGSHGVPAVTWLLALPVLVAVLVSPPQLGSYLAERRAGETVRASAPGEVADLDGEGVVPLGVQEFIWRAQSGGEGLPGQRVALTGFVSHGEGDAWYVTRIAIGCCAADAAPYRVQVDGGDAGDAGTRPERDRWVTVEGTWEDGTGTDFASEPVLRATSVTATAAPAQTYE